MSFGFSKLWHNKAYMQSSVFFLLFFGSWGIWWSFFQIWLTDPQAGMGFDGTKVGTVYSLNSVSSLLIMVFYGAIQDKLGVKRHLVVAAAAMMALIGPFFIWVYKPLLASNFYMGAVLGSIVLSSGFIAMCGLMEALNERLSRVYGFEYGQARMWGSVGYAVVALVAGFAFVVNPEINFWLGSLLGAATLLLLLFWKAPPVSAEKSPAFEQAAPTVAEMFALLKLKSLWVVIGYVFLSWTFYTVFDQQMFPEFYTRQFETPEQGQKFYGMLNSAQVFVEAAMMGVVPLIMRKIGVKKTMLLGVLVMCARIGGCALLSGPVMISFVKMFHALEVPLFILPIFRYFTLHFNPLLSATLYMVGFNIASQVGNVILSPLLGALRDRLGYQTTFLIIAAIVLLAAAYAFVLLKKDDEDVQGEPFVPNRPKPETQG